MLANILNKPLGFFYPSYIYHELKQEDPSPLESELLIQFGQIVHDTLQEVIIKQVKAMGEFDPKELVINLAPEIVARLDNQENYRKFLEERSEK